MLISKYGIGYTTTMASSSMSIHENIDRGFLRRS